MNKLYTILIDSKTFWANYAEAQTWHKEFVTTLCPVCEDTLIWEADKYGMMVASQFCDCEPQAIAAELWKAVIKQQPDMDIVCKRIDRGDTDIQPPYQSKVPPPPDGDWFESALIAYETGAVSVSHAPLVLTSGYYIFCSQKGVR